MIGVLLPVASINVEQNDDKAQAVTGQVGATKDPGESPGTMLPSRHLRNAKKAKISSRERYPKNSMTNVRPAWIVALNIRI